MFCFCWQVATKLVVVEALQSLLVAHRGTHCKHNCSKHPTRGAKWELKLLRNKVRCQVNAVGDLQNRAPVVLFFGVLCLLHKVGCLWQTPVANVLAHGGGELFAPMADCFALVWKSATPWCGFGVLVGKWSKLQSVCKQVAHGWGVLANCNQKATPWWQKRTFLACSCGAKWWQWRNWFPLQKHAHGVGVQSVSDVGCGVSVGGRGSVFSSAVQVLHWLCWAVCSASWASCSAVRCACSTLGV